METLGQVQIQYIYTSLFSLPDACSVNSIYFVSIHFEMIFTFSEPRLTPIVELAGD